MTFGQRLRLSREVKGLSQIDVMERSGVSNKALSRYERGEAEPDIQTLIKLADLLDVSGDYLLGRSPEAPSVSTASDSLLSQILAHLTRIGQSMVEMRDDIQDMKKIAVAGAQLAERVDAHELDIKLIKKAITKE